MTNVLNKAINEKPVTTGMLLALMAATAYGSSQFLAKQIVTEIAPPSVVATVGLFSGFVVLMGLSIGNLPKDRKAPKKAVVFLILSGIASSAGVTFLYTALELAPVVIVAPVSSVTPLISLSLAHIFLPKMESITAKTWVGAILVVAGVSLITIGSHI
ncbi:MAG: putative membrane protein [Chloroflexi bacterium]|jgi:uncharacterized membrane protein|nr:MAG: putative membrane protein [Chloroflexota bacterium]